MKYLVGFAQEYAPVLFGLAVGTVTHFGSYLVAGQLPTLREIAGYLMQLTFIGLFAAVATRLLGMQNDDIRALATAILAISAQEVVKYAKRNGWQPLARAAVPPTVEGERRQAEQLSRSATYLEENDLLDDAIARGVPPSEGKER